MIENHSRAHHHHTRILYAVYTLLLACIVMYFRLEEQMCRYNITCVRTYV